MNTKLSVTKEKSNALKKRMNDLDINESDLEERFIKASGPGGQKVNKTSACVHLKHAPSGIEVKCQKERSQALNRFFARRLLLDKIEKIKLGKQSAQQQKIEKIKRKKRKRSKRAKEKILEAKKKQSIKKQLRANPTL